ncbi:MAG TPA: ABC transporter permease [Bacteroidales bacterium]|nr:ABC transporter permease [Bacteroidales bacterium]
MLINKTIFHFRRSPKLIYTLLSFAGFTVGITAGLLIYLWVFQELQYDKFHPDFQNIYRVLTLSKQNDAVRKSAASYRPLAGTLKRDYPQIEFAAYISYSSEDSPLKTGNSSSFIEARQASVNQDFFKVFRGFEFLEGNPDALYLIPDQIVISKKIKEKLFGKTPAIGKTIISEKYSKKIYTVGAVVDVPDNSSLQFDYLIPETGDNYNNQWADSYWTRVYIKLAKNAVINDDFKHAIANQIQKYLPIKDKLLFQPLADIHLKSDFDDMLVGNPGNIKYLWVLSLLGGFILFMAAFNFSMFSITSSSERSKEIGIRKVNGASRMQILFQFLKETFFQTFSAAALAMILLCLLLPAVNDMTGLSIRIILSFRLIISLIALTALLSLLAGLYPSTCLSALSPVKIIKGGADTGSKAGLIRTLVIVQVSFAAFFLIVTAFLIKQLEYVRTKDLGLQKENIVVIPTGLWYDSDTFKDELLKNTDIKAVSASAYAPVDFSWQVSLPLNSLGKSDSVRMSMIMADQDFAKTYDLKILKGEFIPTKYADYWAARKKKSKAGNDDADDEVSMPVVINETAEKTLGIPDIVGKRINEKLIVGVVKDFHFRPLNYPIEPVMIMNDPENIMTMNVSISPHNRQATIEYVRKVYKKYRDGREMSYMFFEDMLQDKYKAETRLRNITLGLGLAALIISLLGITGMVLFTVNRRIKEIGIRKVNGARTYDVLLLLNKDFIMWAFVSVIIATPVSWLSVHIWLRDFAYKTPISWWVFALTGICILIIILFTVSRQTWKAASRNPVEALRYE